MLGCIIYPSETTVIDEKGSRVVSCPTEDEAREYIRELLEVAEEREVGSNG